MVVVAMEEEREITEQKISYKGYQVLECRVTKFFCFFPPAIPTCMHSRSV